MLLKLFKAYSLREVAAHPWRTAIAVLSIALGVALGFAVHLINQSALAEFSSAVRSVNGQPDIELRAASGMMDERWYAQLALHPQVLHASPVIDIDTFAFTTDGAAQKRRPLRVVGIDALVAAPISPQLLPKLANDADRLALFATDTVFLSAAAQPLAQAGVLELQAGLQKQRFKVAGSVASNEAKAPIAMMDIAAAQWRFDALGKLSRIDIKLVPGASWPEVAKSVGLPDNLRAVLPGDSQERISNLSRAYRVNLTVLALVALFTGGFLVFSIQALSIARRTQQLALLAVLGLTARERQTLVLMESALLGVSGALLGVALGTGLALAALHLLGGDLGGGYFAGVTPTLQFSPLAALVYACLGCVAALVGGWLPARAAANLPPARALKGVFLPVVSSASSYYAIAIIVAAVTCALLPPIGGVAWFAYLSVALLLVGGIALVPNSVSAAIYLLQQLPKRLSSNVIVLLALQRAHHQRWQATVAICGIVASLSLAVALTVMVASFRQSVTQWLDVVLPAELYMRAAQTSSNTPNFFSASDIAVLRRVPGVVRVQPVRSVNLLLQSGRPAVGLTIRDLSGSDPAQALPLVGQLAPVPAGSSALYVSEAMVDLYGAKPGTRLDLPLPGGTLRGSVAGVWRDYARQHGSIVIDSAAWLPLANEPLRYNDAALWLVEGTKLAEVQTALRQALQSGGELVEFASSGEIRALSLTIFDRSFAVTYWLQALAIGIGLFGIAASFSAQVLARRKEFGMLVHLGFTRGQIIKLVACEGAAWTVVGTLLGVALGLAVSVVLVHVVNPQSFHWTMDLRIPWERLAALCFAVLLAGTATALVASRNAAGRDAVRAVNEDW